MQKNSHHFWTSFFALLTSSSTLLCCALPALLVTLGMGATLSSAFSAVPQLGIIGEYKNQLFIFSGIMLSIAGYLQYRARYAPCPIDPSLARTCGKTKRISLIIYFVSLSIYLVGLFFAFIAARLFF